MILIDTCDSHNILQPRIAFHLNLPVQSIQQFSVMVGNGDHIECHVFFSNVSLYLQDHVFHVQCYLLPIEGAYIVLLGLQCLSTLRKVSTDFTVPSLTFLHHDSLISLHSQPRTQILLSTYNQFCQFMHSNSIASIHFMSFEPVCPKPNTIPPSLVEEIQFQQLPTEIHTFLSYPQLFSKLTSLPPPRPHDHHITLLSNTAPITVKPYCYPHSQKEIMKKLISEML